MTQFSEPAQHQFRQLIDAGLGGGALSSPVWLQWVEGYAGAFLAVGGSVILVGRLVWYANLGWKKWKQRKTK